MRRSRRQIAVPSLFLAVTLTAAATSSALAAGPTVVVEPGDTLSGIALEHGVGVGELATLNDLANPNRILAGQVLRLPAAAQTSQPTAPPAPAAAPHAATRTHTVAAGENLTWIARRYGVTVAAIVAANDIANASRIFAGQRLVIPGTTPAAPAPAAAAMAAPASATTTAPAPAASRTHTVASGENLTWIARRYGVTVAAIVAANDIADASRIFAGQRLVIPGTPAATSAASSASRMPAEMEALVSRRDTVRTIIAEEANRYGVPVAFALAVAWQESGWQQGVTSHAGAMGVMQLLPSTADWVGSSLLGATVNPSDTRSNVRAGVRLLAYYLSYYDGSRELALSAYYQGQSATDRHGIYPLTRPYIASILALEPLFVD